MLLELFISVWGIYYCTCCSLITHDFYINRNNPDYQLFTTNDNLNSQNIENSIIY
jgi:hypothetical protein